MRKILGVVVCLLVYASLATAQNKLETKWHCGKPTAEHRFDVGDMPDHAYVISQGTCTATSSSGGEKTGAYTEFQETRKDSFANHGRFNVTLENGDKTYYTYEGTGNPGKKMASNKWKILSGTGKHKATTGSGSCTGKLLDDGGSDWVCSGTWSAGK